MNYSSYNPNQPQPQQSYYEYDPSQIQLQSYDQSYAAAAATYQPSYYAAAYNQQYAASYYPTGVDTTPVQQSYYQTEPNPVHPPGVNPEPVQQSFANNNYLAIGPSSQYRGGGGRSFRWGGRGRGQFNRGRGRGVGSGRHFPSNSSGPAISDVPAASAAAGATDAVQGSSSVSAQVQTAAVQPPPRGVFCDICKIECNTSEVMQVHLQGKKHLKNVRLHEAKQRRNAINGSQSSQIPSSQLNSTDQSVIAQELEDPTKSMSSEIAADVHKDEMMLQNNVGETCDVPAEEPDGLRMDNTGERDCGLKRKLRAGGKGRKQMRTTDGSIPEKHVAITCELCNVKCATERVYQAHITGKKHMKRASGYQGPAGVGNQALVGVGNQALSEVVGSQALPSAVGLQALYPPDINALASAINAQVEQGDNDPQVLLAQLLVNALSQAQASTTAPPNGTLAAQTPASEAGSGSDPQLVQTQVSEVAADVGVGNPTGEIKNEMLSVPLESNAQEGSNAQVQQGDNDLQVLLGQLLVNALSQAQGSTIAPPNGTLAAQTPASEAGSGYDPQLVQTQVSEVAADVGVGNPTGEIKNEMLSVPLESNAQEGSNVGTQIEGGSSETK